MGKASTIDELLERLEQLEEDLLHTIENDREIFRAPGVLDATQKIKEALQCLHIAKATHRIR